VLAALLAARDHRGKNDGQIDFYFDPPLHVALDLIVQIVIHTNQLKCSVLSGVPVLHCQFGLGIVAPVPSCW
jgi:hypothetical protein